jgi:hypothetical protein
MNPIQGVNRHDKKSPNSAQMTYRQTQPFLKHLSLESKVTLDSVKVRV